MRNRSIIKSICHGVLASGLVLAAVFPAQAGGPDPSRPKVPTFLETVLASRKGSLDVEWEITKVTTALSQSPNLYQIKIIEPAIRRNVTLLVNDKPAIHLEASVQTFSFDFSNYPPGEVKATLVVFDDFKAGSSTKKVKVTSIAVPGLPVAPVPVNTK